MHIFGVRGEIEPKNGSEGDGRFRGIVVSYFYWFVTIFYKK